MGSSSDDVDKLIIFRKVRRFVRYYICRLSTLRFLHTFTIFTHVYYIILDLSH